MAWTQSCNLLGKTAHLLRYIASASARASADVPLAPNNATSVNSNSTTIGETSTGLYLFNVVVLA